MRLPAPIRLLIALVAILASAPASAQVYKWVDALGVTNYSNDPPADPKAAKKVAIIEDRVSVYTPDKSLTQAIEADRQRSNQVLSRRIDDLERQLDAERRARQYAAAEVPVAYDPCLSGRALDCMGTYGDYYPYGYTTVFYPRRHLPRKIVQPHIAPGTIAGNVVGMNGFIPGNSVSAFTGTTFPFSSLQAASIGRSFPRK
jgi:hypothetical protein